MTADRYVVVLSHLSFEDAGVAEESVAFGPFRSRERAERRAGVIRREAEQYDDPEGVTGPDNALDVRVWRLYPGSTSANDAMRHIYDLED